MALTLPNTRIRGKRHAILEAAARLFMTLGYSTTSMDAVAAEANVSKATIYNHFADKNTLFEAMMTERCAALLDDVFTIDTDCSVREGLITLGTRFLNMILGQEAICIHRLVSSELKRFPELGAMFYRAGPRSNFIRLAEYLRLHTERGNLTLEDPDIAAKLLVGMFKSDIHTRCLLGLSTGEDKKEIAERVEQAVELFLMAYGRKG